MALRDWIFKHGESATATVATPATLESSGTVTVAKVATVAVAGEGKKKNDCVSTELQSERSISVNSVKSTIITNTPSICANCERLELVEIMGSPVPGCLYTAPGEYADGWKRLPVTLRKCLWN